MANEVPQYVLIDVQAELAEISSVGGHQIDIGQLAKVENINQGPVEPFFLGDELL